jgi:hypothetical protein
MDVSSSAGLIRSLLRDAGFMDYEPGRRGFIVEGDPEGGWVSVTCHPGLPWARARRGRDLARYREIVSTAGFEVVDSPWRAGVLRVTLPAEAREL